MAKGNTQTTTRRQRRDSDNGNGSNDQINTNEDEYTSFTLTLGPRYSIWVNRAISLFPQLATFFTLLRSTQQDQIMQPQIALADNPQPISTSPEQLLNQLANQLNASEDIVLQQYSTKATDRSKLGLGLVRFAHIIESFNPEGRKVNSWIEDSDNGKSSVNFRVRGLVMKELFGYKPTAQRNGRVTIQFKGVSFDTDGRIKTCSNYHIDHTDIDRLKQAAQKAQQPSKSSGSRILTTSGSPSGNDISAG